MLIVALAHLAERLLCKQEAWGSIPQSYTFFFITFLRVFGQVMDGTSTPSTNHFPHTHQQQFTQHFHKHQIQK
jgi:hypothetical protein